MRHNCAFLSQGCSIFEQSPSTLAPNSADRILCPCNASWTALREPIPYCIVDLSKVAHRPEMLNKIGFYNATSAPACPSFIQVYYRSKIGEKWLILGEFALQRLAGWQTFTFNPIPFVRMSLVYIKLCDNFHGKEVRLTKFGIGFEDDLWNELQAAKTENKKLKERIAQQEKNYDQMKDIILKMERQIKFMLNETESESSCEFEKLNSSDEEDNNLPIIPRTVQITIDENGPQENDKFEILD